MEISATVAGTQALPSTLSSPCCWQYFPAVQGVHCETLVRPSPAPYEPGTHAWGSTVPSSQ